MSTFILEYQKQVPSISYVCQTVLTIKA